MKEDNATDRLSDEYGEGYDAVSEWYKRTASETAPERANHAILAMAAKTSTKRRKGNWRFSWLQPAALVVTLGVSLAIVMQVSNFDSPSSVTPDIDPTTLSSPSTVFDEAANATIERIREADREARSNAGPTQAAPPPVSVERASDATNRTPAANIQCTAIQRSTTESWWQCAKALESRGMTVEATQEFEALFEAYPAFDIPPR